MDAEIDKLVKSSIETKIIEAFRSTPQMIDELVQAALRQEVGEHGGKPDYYTRDKMPYLTWLARSAIQDVARSAVQQHVKELEPEIRDAVKRALSSDVIVDAFCKHILGHTTEDWRILVTFATKDKTD